jgi:predicted phosphodiesterase
MPDIENQRFRHVHDCLNQYQENRDRFVELLQKYDAKAYIVGHTHNYSTVKVNNLWHMDAGHARGDGDKGTKSPFIRIKVNGGDVSYFTYRRTPDTSVYELADKGKFN